MRKLLMLALIAFAPTTAFAGTFDNSIGNTVIVRTADGASIQTRIKADGTVRGARTPPSPEPGSRQ